MHITVIIANVKETNMTSTVKLNIYSLKRDALCSMRLEGRNLLDEAKEHYQQLLMELNSFALTQLKCDQKMYFNGDPSKSNGKATRSGLTIPHSLYYFS
uniref:Uncharacterized protein n=1 Tax=Glossina palpalis gambiensis TaxID=67801 RepID=A0A1B0BRZ7_9MUSC